MTDAVDLSRVQALVFDYYGTIVDMQAGLTEAIRPFLSEKGYTGEPGRVVTWWRRTHFEDSMIDALLHREHTAYREVGRRAVSVTLERAGIPFTDEEVRWLVAQIERLRPFADVPEALARLKTRYALVVLSNGDPDMLEAGVANSGLAFEHVFSVADANAFKPHVATYRMAAERLGLQPQQILFVANHVFDCVGAKAFGMRSAYVNRRRRPFGYSPYQPDLEVPDFRSLADRLIER
jgi:2-haloacid dehalogenase